MILATLSSPITYLTGIIEWKQKYKGAKVRVFMMKYRYGLCLLGLGILCTFWYFLNPKILTDKGELYILFVILNFSIIPLAIYLGYLGGKLAYGVTH
jgi:hypothetical protein